MKVTMSMKVHTKKYKDVCCVCLCVCLCMCMLYWPSSLGRFSGSPSPSSVIGSLQQMEEYLLLVIDKASSDTISTRNVIFFYSGSVTLFIKTHSGVFSFKYFHFILNIISSSQQQCLLCNYRLHSVFCKDGKMEDMYCSNILILLMKNWNFLLTSTLVPKSYVFHRRGLVVQLGWGRSGHIGGSWFWQGHWPVAAE